MFTMSYRYQLATYRDSLGKLRVDLVDELGLFVEPWITSLLRNHSGKFNTILDNGYQLAFLLKLANVLNINIVNRIESGVLLTSGELRCLLRAIKRKADSAECLQSNVTLISQFKGKALSNLIYGTNIHENRVSGPTIKKRLNALIGLIEWIFTKVHSNGLNAPPEDLLRRYRWLIEELKLAQKSIKKDNTIVKGTLESVLPEPDFFRMLIMAHPDNPHNPWTSKNRLRNYIIICLLNETGIRRGEAAGIKVTNLLLNGERSQIEITKVVDDLHDMRKRPPSTKTTARFVTLSQGLMQQIMHYIEVERIRFTKGKTHDFLFVSHQGRTTGDALDNQSINYIFTRLRLATGIVGLTPHKLRHKYNEVFDEKARKRGYTKAQRDDMRRTACGWTHGSIMVDHYNDFCLAQETWEIKSAMQQDIVPIIPPEPNDNDV